MDDELERRRALTFRQAEGIDPLPSQLSIGQVSRELRARIWRVLFSSLSSTARPRDWDSPLLGPPWERIFYDWFTLHEHGFADDFSNEAKGWSAEARRIIEHGDYSQVFELLQFIMRHRECPYKFDLLLANALETSQAAYRIVDKTIVPITSEEEGQAIQKAFADLDTANFPGARTHLRQAAEYLTSGNWPDAVRESIHAVESAAKALEPSASTLGPALQKMEKAGRLNPNLRRAINALYDYTSDEKGVRHALVLEDVAQVGEAEALFMFGTCAAFISFLTRFARS